MKRALIAGGGIGGLAAGIALGHAGYEVMVLERSPEPREVGAGVGLLPNGVRALRVLGVSELPGSELSRLVLRTWRGRDLTQTDFRVYRKRYGSGLRVVLRPQLHSLLMEVLGSERMTAGAEVTGFRESAGSVTVILRDGREVEGDLLVGADGLRSAVRRQLLADGEPRYLGCTAWRGVTELAGTGLDPAVGLSWWGPGGEFGALPLGELVYWFGTANAPAGEHTEAGHQTDLLERFGGWQPPIRDLIASTRPEAILRNDIYDRRPGLRWTVGRVTLLGDAAHPMAPNAAQGACQALEDAVALGESGLEGYERRRLKRANDFVRIAYQSSRAVQSENGLLVAVRNLGARLVPQALVLRQADAYFRPA